MKNIEKTIKKIVKLYQFETHDVSVKGGTNSSSHVHNIMDNLGNGKNKQDQEDEGEEVTKINLNDLINQQLKLILTDSNIDCNLLISVVTDFTRKVFSKEMIKFITVLSD